MELFVCAHGLLFTMTTIAPSFFAPDRLESHRASKEAAWRPLLISVLIHGLGAVLVVVLSQLSLDSQKKPRFKDAAPKAEISARLYYPSTTPTQQQIAEDTVDAKTIKKQVESAVPVEKQTPKTLPNTQNKSKDSTTNMPQEVNPEREKPTQQKSNAEAEPALDAFEHPNAPTSRAHSTDANRRAGALNLSAKDGAAQYFREYRDNQISDDAERAAAAYQQRKNRPELKGYSTLEREAIEQKRYTKRVNCSSTASKTLAIISGIAGGTLECTKMGDHNRFIDARIKKHPVDEEQNVQ